MSQIFRKFPLLENAKNEENISHGDFIRAQINFALRNEGKLRDVVGAYQDFIRQFGRTEPVIYTEAELSTLLQYFNTTHFQAAKSVIAVLLGEIAFSHFEGTTNICMTGEAIALLTLWARQTLLKNISANEDATAAAMHILSVFGLHKDLLLLVRIEDILAEQEHFARVYVSQARENAVRKLTLALTPQEAEFERLEA
jgi:hypothetical protein